MTARARDAKYAAIPVKRARTEHPGSAELDGAGFEERIAGICISSRVELQRAVVVVGQVAGTGRRTDQIKQDIITQIESSATRPKVKPDGRAGANRDASDLQRD